MRNLSDRELLSLFDTAVAGIEAGAPPEALRDRSIPGGDPRERKRRPLMLLVAASVIAGALVAGGAYWLTSAETDAGRNSIVADESDSNTPSTPTTGSERSVASCEGPSLLVDSFGKGYPSPEDALRAIATEPGQQTRVLEVLPTPDGQTDPGARGVVLDPDGTVVKSVGMSLTTDGWSVGRITVCQ